MIDEKGVATAYTKLEKGELIASDENNNIIFIEKLPENISQKQLILNQNKYIK